MTSPHVEVLTEEPFREAFLEVLLPRLMPQATFAVHSFQNKQSLLNKLTSRLRAYKKWLPENYRIAVLIDRDNGDCLELKERLESIAVGSGLVTRTRIRDGRWQVVNRIVVEELEAWYFGDWEAVCTAYPRASPNVPRKAAYRCPDSINSPWRKSPLHSSGDASRLTALFVGYICPICALLTPCQAGASPLSVQRGVSPRAVKGGTWEAFERILQRYGCFEGGLRKVEAARAIAQFVDPARNRSHSFRNSETPSSRRPDERTGATAVGPGPSTGLRAERFANHSTFAPGLGPDALDFSSSGVGTGFRGDAVCGVRLRQRRHVRSRLVMA